MLEHCLVRDATVKTGIVYGKMHAVMLCAADWGLPLTRTLLTTAVRVALRLPRKLELAERSFTINLQALHGDCHPCRSASAHHCAWVNDSSKRMHRVSFVLQLRAFVESVEWQTLPGA